MKVALFIPCYVDAFFPEVGIATLELLERLGHRGRVSARPDLLRPADGQQRLPRGGGRDRGAVRAQLRGLRLHRRAVGQLHPPRARPPDAIAQTPEVQEVRRNTYELVEFLHDILEVREFPVGRVPAQGRAAQRLLDAARADAGEDVGDRRAALLQAAGRCSPRSKGIEFVEPQRPDECCGFGGTFSVFEEPVSAKMGYDKVSDHRDAGAEYIVSADMSCLMHQKGCAERLGLPIKFIHIAQILNGARA